jgi:hypothetical protein
MAQSASAEVVSITTLKGTGSSSSSSAKVSKASKKRSKSISDITGSTATDAAASVDSNNTPAEQRYVAVVAVRRLTFEVRTSASDDVDSDVSGSGMTSSAIVCQSDEQRVIRVAVLGSVDAVSATHHCVLL